jgi:hypothetical protein
VRVRAAQIRAEGGDVDPQVTNTSHESGPTWTGELSSPCLGVAIGAHGGNEGGGPLFPAGIDESEATAVALLPAWLGMPIEAAVLPQPASDSTSPTSVTRTLARTNP